MTILESLPPTNSKLAHWYIQVRKVDWFVGHIRGQEWLLKTWQKKINPAFQRIPEKQIASVGVCATSSEMRCKSFVSKRQTAKPVPSVSPTHNSKSFLRINYKHRQIKIIGGMPRNSHRFTLKSKMNSIPRPVDELSAPAPLRFTFKSDNTKGDGV